MRAKSVILLMALVVGLQGFPAHADSVMYFQSSQHYYSANNSPFSGASNVVMENFEDGLLNAAGMTANRGKVRGPGSNTDSVDGDDGNINGLGRNGHSYTSGSAKSITFRFNGTGNAPDAAGLVWTDGRKNSRIVFSAWDKNGDFIGKIKVTLGDLKRNGRTKEDRFLGIASDKGISKIKITSNYAGFEIDHLQFAYGISVVPLPAPLALGLAGLAGVIGYRRLRRREV